jgi:hypothetical protein
VLAEAGEPARIDGKGAWTGPVLVLVGGETASAAEDFAGWLSENGIGRLVGARTAGAGCGYVNGGNVSRFAASPFQVKMPNCARFLEDGTNEIEGFAPDIPLPMERPEEAASALERLLAGGEGLGPARLMACGGALALPSPQGEGFSLCAPGTSEPGFTPPLPGGEGWGEGRGRARLIACGGTPHPALSPGRGFFAVRSQRSSAAPGPLSLTERVSRHFSPSR